MLRRRRPSLLWAQFVRRARASPAARDVLRPPKGRRRRLAARAHLAPLAAHAPPIGSSRAAGANNTKLVVVAGAAASRNGKDSIVERKRRRRRTSTREALCLPRAPTAEPREGQTQFYRRAIKCFRRRTKQSGSIARASLIVAKRASARREKLPRCRAAAAAFARSAAPAMGCGESWRRRRATSPAPGRSYRPARDFISRLIGRAAHVRRSSTRRGGAARTRPSCAFMKTRRTLSLKSDGAANGVLQVYSITFSAAFVVGAARQAAIVRRVYTRRLI